MIACEGELSLHMIASCTATTVGHLLLGLCMPRCSSERVAAPLLRKHLLLHAESLVSRRT